MRMTISLILLFMSAQSFAIATKNDDMSSTNLPAAYSTSSTSLLVTGLGSGIKRRLMITNTSTSHVCCNVVTASTSSAPSSNDGTELCIPGSAIKAWDDIPIVKNVYCRSNSGSPISTGNLMVEVW